LNFIAAEESRNELPVVYVEIRVLEELGPGSMDENCHPLI